MEGVYRDLLDRFPPELPTTVRVRIVVGAHPYLDRVALAAALELGGTARQVSVQISQAVTHGEHAAGTRMCPRGRRAGGTA